MKRLFVTMTASVLCAVSVGGQESQEQFLLQINTELVVRTVSVRDGDGRPLVGLAAQDFIVSEDGVPQTISVFEFHAIDDTPAGSSTRPPGNDQNRSGSDSGDRASHEFVGESRYKDRRLLAFYFDLVGMSESERIRAFEAARKFVSEERTVADLVAILAYSTGRVRLVREFTSDPVQLLASLEALGDGYVPSSAQNGADFDVFATDRRLKAVETALRLLGRLNEAKSLIYFSSGVNLEVTNQAQLRATVNAANRANVSIFPIDSRGLSAFAPLGNANQSAPGGIAAFTATSAMRRSNAFQRSQDALYTLASDTDGKVFLDSNDLTAGIVEAQRASSGYYVLGYYPTDASRDGGLRKVKVELTHRSGDIAYQETYYAQKEFGQSTAEDREGQLEEALLLGDPITDLTIAAEANYFRVNAAEYFVPVAVRMPGNELLMGQGKGADQFSIDFVGEIRNEAGLVVTSLRDRVEMTLTNKTQPLLESSPVQYDTGFTLEPGRYTLKLLARNSETGRMGTYQTLLVIPDLTRSPSQLPISSVVLGKQRVDMSEVLLNADGHRAEEEEDLNPLVQDGQKLIPSIGRVFSRDEPLHIYFEIYRRDALASETMVAIVTLHNGQERVFETPAFAVPAPDDPDPGTVPVALTVGLDQLWPGEYTCQVTILRPEAQEAAFWQTQLLIVR